MVLRRYSRLLGLILAVAVAYWFDPSASLPVVLGKQKNPSPEPSPAPPAPPATPEQNQQAMAAAAEAKNRQQRRMRGGTMGGTLATGPEGVLGSTTAPHLTSTLGE
jgi:hypothetical protein